MSSQRPGRDPVDLGRRRLLVAGLTAGGGFLLGLPVLTLQAAKEAGQTGGEIGFFVEIRPDNQVIIGCAQPEIGQGVRTSMPMLVAEELDVEWSAVTVRQMPLGLLKTADGYTWKYGGQGAGGSTSVTDNWEFLREVGASARLMLMEAAARRWGVPVAECRTEPGVVMCDRPANRLSYAELAAEAAQLPVAAGKAATQGPLPVPDHRKAGQGCGCARNCHRRSPLRHRHGSAGDALCRDPALSIP